MGKAPSLRLLFYRQQLLLALHAPAIAAQAAVFADHTVARDCYCYRVGGAGSGYGSRGLWHAYLFCYDAVRAGLATVKSIHIVLLMSVRRGPAYLQRNCEMFLA